MASSLKHWADRASGGRDLEALAAASPPVFDKTGGWVEDGVTLRLEQNERAFDVGLPALFRDADITDRRVMTWIQYNLTDRRRHSHLLLLGNTGSGKTTNLVGAVKRLVTSAVESREERSPSWLYVTHGQVARQMRDFRDNSSRDLFDRLLDVDILVLDELGSVPGREWGIEWLSDLIDTRYRECRTLMTATNKSLKELKEMLGDDRIVSRLAEGHNMIRMDDNDYRLRTGGFIS